MLSLIEKLKTAGIIALLIFVMITSVATWLLIKDNQQLRAELAIKKGELSQCMLQVEHAEKEKEVVDKTLDDVFNEHEKLAEDYGQLQERFDDIRCGKTKVSSGKKVNENDSSDAGNIAAVGVLLENAACLANGNCKPPESPSKAM